MFTRYLPRLAVAAALWMTHYQPSSAQAVNNPNPQSPAQVPTSAEPARHGLAADPKADAASAQLANQAMAEKIAEAIRRSGRIRNFTIDISFQNGVSELTGQVVSGEQREEVQRLVQSVPGVKHVHNHLRLAGGLEIVPAQAVKPGQDIGPPPMLLPQPGPGKVPEIGPPPALLPNVTNPPQEPMPIFQGPPGPHPTQPPPMPPYAWPTFAPYNNYSRVATPTLYPYQSWPFIGPMYPFPKVPLGWRSITLTWQDGHWWYGKNASGHDWWRVRYW